MNTGEQPLAGMRALIIIPGSVSYFYDAEGRRVAQALRNLGATADVHTLHDYPVQPYDWCFLMNLSEIEFAYQHAERMMQHIKYLQTFCDRMATILLESVEMKWFFDSLRLLQKARINILIDLGFHNQYQRATRDARKVYHFVFNGLTHDERARALDKQTPCEARPIPWAFIGHLTPQRMWLLESVTQKLDRGGFLYMVHFTPVTETGPHLNQEQFHRVLTHTRYQLWCSHHPYFYIESIRFRMGLMAGSVPVKINLNPEHSVDPALPFSYLIFDLDDFGERLSLLDFASTRQQFIDDFMNFPTLESGLRETLQQLG